MFLGWGVTARAEGGGPPTTPRRPDEERGPGPAPASGPARNDEHYLPFFRSPCGDSQGTRPPSLPHQRQNRDTRVTGARSPAITPGNSFSPDYMPGRLLRAFPLLTWEFSTSAKRGRHRRSLPCRNEDTRGWRR